jgi:hypothetical protein
MVYVYVPFIYNKIRTLALNAFEFPPCVAIGELLMVQNWQGGARSLAHPLISNIH